MKFTHKFTESGLGKAPFRFVGVHENAFKLPDGTSKAGGSCSHCGTGIRWEFHIISADGVRSKVGSDCIHKAGDKGLIDIAKEEINKRRREAAHAKREEQRMADLQAQRDRNNGLTDWELEVRVAEEKKQAELQRRSPAISYLEPLADRLEDGKGGFCDSVASGLRNGEIAGGYGRNLICEIIAKKKGRKNSKAYKAEFAVIDAQLKQAEVLLSAV